MASDAKAEREAQVRREIEQMEDEHRLALLNGDIDSIERNEADDIIVTSPANVIVTKQEFVARVRSGSLRHAAFKKHIERITVHGDCAIVAGREVIVTGPSAPAPGLTVHRRYTSVYVRRGNGWVMAARHASEMLPR